jgi:hypothetical protein
MNTRVFAQTIPKAQAAPPARSNLWQRKPSEPSTLNSQRSTAPPIVHDVLRSSGRPLDAATCAFFEPRFGHDLSQVRVHTDGKAAESARAVKALAYTVGHDIVFDRGAYDPTSADGRSILAHELLHVRQQLGVAQPSPLLLIGRTDDAAERDPNRADSAPTVRRTTWTREELLAAYREALARGDWKEVAIRLNGFEAGDIRRLAAQLRHFEKEQVSSAVKRHLAGWPNEQMILDALWTRDELLTAYHDAVARKDWREAAVRLNGFDRRDIQHLVANLTVDEIRKTAAELRKLAWAGTDWLLRELGVQAEGLDSPAEAPLVRATGPDPHRERPLAAGLAALPASFVVRYLSYDPPKNLTPAEAGRWHSLGISIVVVFEATGDRALAGLAAGARDAAAADAQARACGQPAGRPIYFAVDFAPVGGQIASVEAYFTGVSTTLGVNRTGAYAGKDMISRLFDKNLIHWGWQTLAWSQQPGWIDWDPRAQLHQIDNDAAFRIRRSFDRNRAMAQDFGQW